MIDVCPIQVCICIKSILLDAFSVLSPLSRMWNFCMSSKFSLIFPLSLKILFEEKGE